MSDNSWGESDQPHLVFLDYEQSDLRSMREFFAKTAERARGVDLEPRS